MSIPLNVNGEVFDYPVNLDEDWGVNATGWAQAVTNGMLQMAGGSFPLTADVNFGANFGLLAKYFETRSSLPATAGTVRLASADAGIGWRNNANSGNLILTTNSSDQLLYNGHPIASTGGGAVTSITGTANQIIASAATGDVTLSTPQNIATTSSPTFAALTLTAPLTVSNGGTGDSSLTAYAVLTGGTASTTPVQSIASVGLAGQVLTSNGPGALPSFSNTTGSGTVNSGTAGNIAYYATSSASISDAGLARTNLFLADGTISATGAFNLNSHKVTNLTNGSSAQDAVAFTQLSTGNAITAGGITNHTITATQITAATITTTEVTSNTLTGSTANSGGSAGNIAQGTISSPDFRANAVTANSTSQSGTIGTTGTTITTTSLITIGGPVFVTYHFTVQLSVSGGAGAVSSYLLCDGVEIAGGACTPLGQASAGTLRLLCTASIIHTPTSGAHTYTVGYIQVNGTGFSTATGQSLTAIEMRA